MRETMYDNTATFLHTYFSQLLRWSFLLQWKSGWSCKQNSNESDLKFPQTSQYRLSPTWCQTICMISPSLLTVFSTN